MSDYTPEQLRAAADGLLAWIRSIKAAAWEEGWQARSERPHLKRGEALPAPEHINPYREQETP